MSKQTLTIAAVRSTLATLGITLKRDEVGDFIVNLKGGREATAYYTDDLRDALHTGEAMARRAAAPTLTTREREALEAARDGRTFNDRDGNTKNVTLRRLRAAGLIAANRWAITDAGRALLAAQQPESKWSALPDINSLSRQARDGQRDDSSKPKLTSRIVNAALKARGVRGEIHQGRGYVYFSGDDFDGAYSTSVAVCWLNDLSLDGWLAEARYILEHDVNLKWSTR